jgi:DNA-binding HxlR family transcriptional regulator
MRADFLTILKYLADLPVPVILRHTNVPGMTQNTVGSRLPQLRNLCYVDKRKHEGTQEAEWFITPTGRGAMHAAMIVAENERKQKAWDYTEPQGTFGFPKPATQGHLHG